MSKQIINIGSAPNSKNGDSIRDAFAKVNANFTELYSATGADVQIPVQTNQDGKFLTTNEGALSWSTINHIGDDTQFINIDPDTGMIVIQSGFDATIGHVYIKGSNCSDGGVGGNVIIEAGGAPLPNDGTTGNIELCAQQVTIESNNNMWSFRDDGVLELPQGGDIVDSDGNTVLGGTGGGISIADFGEGFGLDNSDKIVTNKLYSTNETQPNQHYRLELDTNGVVHLPDQSIINGATLKSVPGNYAGITAGPVGADEDSWMWVDGDGAWVGTKYNTDQKLWQFTNDGKLQLPAGGTIVDSDGVNILNGLGGGGSSYNQSLNTTDNVTFNKLKIANGLHAPAAGGAYDKIKLYDFADVAKVNYAIGTEDHHIWMSVDDTTAGFKWYGGTNLALTLVGNGTMTVPGGAQIIPKIQGTNSIDLKAGVNGWAELLSNNEESYIWVDNTGAYVGTNGANQWTFGTDGYLQLPAIGQGIKNSNASQKVRFYGDGVKVDANGNTWTFGNDATLTFPDTTSQIFTSGTGLTLKSPNHKIRLIAQDSVTTGSAQVYVKSDTKSVDIVTDADGSNTKTWTFGSNGSTTLPNGVVIGSEADGFISPSESNGVVGLKSQDGLSKFDVSNAYGARIRRWSAGHTNEKYWTFDADGKISLPNTGTVNNGDTPVPAVGTIITCTDGFDHLTPSVNGTQIALQADGTTSLIEADWIITFHDGTTRTVTHADIDNFGGWIVQWDGSVNLSSSDVWPLTAQSPDYQASYNLKNLELTPDGVKTWTLIEDGTLLTPDYSTIQTGTSLNLASPNVGLFTTNTWINMDDAGNNITNKIQLATNRNGDTICKWEFDGSGTLTLPQYGTNISQYDDETTFAGGTNGDIGINVEASKTIYLRVGTTAWAFGNAGGIDDKILHLPAGGDIVDSDGVSVLSNGERSFEIKTSTFNAVAGHRYGVNTTSGPITANLPVNPAVGDAIFFVDSHGTFTLNNLTIDGGGLPNGKQIMGMYSQIISVDNDNVGLFYNGTEWRFYA